MEGIFKILVHRADLDIAHFVKVVQLATSAAGYLCLFRCARVACILHIGSGVLAQSCIDCLLVPKVVNLCESHFSFLLQL